MSESFLNGRVILHSGNCLDVLARMAECSVDSCVTDPPYHLTSIVKRFANSKMESEPFAEKNPSRQFGALSRGFMGKQWDGGNIAFDSATWCAVYRVLKPGGHLLAMGGTRTFDMLGAAIRAAGFDVRDTLAWITGQGFPKNLDVSKRMRQYFSADVLSACARCDWQIVQGSPSDCLSYPHCDDAQLQSEANTDLDGLPLSGDARAHSRDDLLADARDAIQASIFDDEGNDRRANGYSQRPPLPPSEDYQASGNAPFDTSLNTSSGEAMAAHRSQPHKSGTSRSDDGSDFSTRYANLPQCPQCGKRGIPNGLGTALKPAMELCVLARKPLSEGTVAANVLRWGTGAINVDGCRVGTDEITTTKTAMLSYGGDNHRPWHDNHVNSVTQHTGRWPANVVHDGSDEVVAAFPDAKSRGEYTDSQDIPATPKQLFGNAIGVNDRNNSYANEIGSAARFFYTAKADADDRLGSKHPTVKPLNLMQWLVRLVTPRGGVVLDPFAGTGTTGEAAWREGMRAVLIEAEAEYQADIRRRMALALVGPDERSRESIRAKNLPVDYGPLFGFREAAE